MRSLSSSRKKRHGFSLVESAIVLGVFGMVIGGIWVAASAVYQNQKLNEARQGIITIAANLRNMMTNRDAIALSDGDDLTSAAIAGNVFPAQWVSGSSVTSPFGKQVKIIHYGTVLSDVRFDIRYYDVPKDACISLIVQMSTIAAKSGGGDYVPGTSTCWWMEVGNNDFSSYTWGQYKFSSPVSLSTATTACAYTQNDMVFTFNYRVY